MNTYQKQFDIRKETSAYWHNKSVDLLVSARTLWKAIDENKNLEINCLPVYKMLLGMSFELLFKAHCVGAGIGFAATHNLESLVTTANLTTSKDEKGIFRVLSEYIIWDGRYPVPKEFQYLERHWENQNNILNNNENIGNLIVLTSNDKLDFENIHPIWRKYSDLFMEKHQENITNLSQHR